jgi:hypothetical protein
MWGRASRPSEPSDSSAVFKPCHGLRGSARIKNNPRRSVKICGWFFAFDLREIEIAISGQRSGLFPSVRGGREAVVCLRADCARHAALPRVRGWGEVREVRSAGSGKTQDSVTETLQELSSRAEWLLREAKRLTESKDPLSVVAEMNLKRSSHGAVECAGENSLKRRCRDWQTWGPSTSLSCAKRTTTSLRMTNC